MDLNLLPRGMYVEAIIFQKERRGEASKAKQDAFKNSPCSSGPTSASAIKC
jgi:hypothetical protein